MRLLDFEKPVYDIEKRIEELRALLKDHPELEGEIKNLEEQAKRIKEKIYTRLTSWQKVQLARHPDRPHSIDYIEGMTEEFIELKGDRLFRDDPSIIGGLAKIEGKPIVIIGQEKGRSTKEKIHRNFGMTHPEGYRKANRLMKLAEKFNLPVLTLVDTPGAYPGIGAEERGQAMAIAESLKTMLSLKTPFISVIIGEGGSGGALGIALGDVVLALEYSIYSVISPEGCASILWKDGKEAPKAAEALKLTAKDLLELKIIDEIVPEPEGGAHRDPEGAIQTLKEYVVKHLENLEKKRIETLLKRRRERYKKYGVFKEP
jgi:acetyl-CoA carboxylase carboxyl transferase subunit alpha